MAVDQEVLPGRKRIMRRFKLTEISNVDRPAQKGAVALLLKNSPAEPPPVRKPAPPAPAPRIEAPASFEEVVAKLKEAGMRGTDAMAKAHAEYPELFNKYQAAGSEAVAKASALPKTSADVQRFRQRVEAIRQQRGCSPTEAMKRARDEHPDEFEKFQAA